VQRRQRARGHHAAVGTPPPSTDVA
jgi:hypothetical protein